MVTFGALVIESGFFGCVLTLTSSLNTVRNSCHVLRVL